MDEQVQRPLTCWNLGVRVLKYKLHKILMAWQHMKECIAVLSCFFIHASYPLWVPGSKLHILHLFDSDYASACKRQILPH